jgi:hypothetical protein
LLIACTLLVAIILTLISIKVAAAPVWPGVAPEQTVNHAGKGDRLPLVLASDPNAANRPVNASIPRTSVEHSLPDGCEALASPLTRSAVADIAGRCVS